MKKEIEGYYDEEGNFYSEDSVSEGHFYKFDLCKKEEEEDDTLTINDLKGNQVTIPMQLLKDAIRYFEDEKEGKYDS